MRVAAWWRLDGVMLVATDVSADRCRCERMSLRRHRVVHLVVAVLLTEKGDRKWCRRCNRKWCWGCSCRVLVVRVRGMVCILSGERSP